MRGKNLKNLKKHVKKRNSRIGLFFNYFKKLFSKAFAISFAMSALAYSKAVSATHADELLWGGREEEVQVITGLGSRDPILILAGLIRIFLSFLGILAVVIIILAGFKWMLSGGNEEKASEAKRMLISGIIGLAIILASFGLVRYLLNTLPDVFGAI